MSRDHFHRLPDDVTIPTSEVTDAIVRLDDLAEELRIRSDPSTAEEIEVVIGLMTAWLWPLLRDIDDEGGQ